MNLRQKEVPMKLSEAPRIPFLDGIRLIADRPTRRRSRTINHARQVERVKANGMTHHREKLTEEEANRQRAEARDSLLPDVSELRTRGYQGVEYDLGDRLLTVWWFTSVSWKVTNVWRLVRGRHYCTSEKGRQSVTFSWKGLDALELAKIEAAIGSERFAEVKTSISKKEFQSSTGAKNPPVGVKQLRETTTVKAVIHDPDTDPEEDDTK
jgi:hypothetical protein